MTDDDFRPGRRRFAGGVLAGAAGLAFGAPAFAQDGVYAVENEAEPLRRRISGAISRDWRDHFDSLSGERRS